MKKASHKAGKIFAMHINDKELEYRIHKMFYKLMQKYKQLNLKMGSIHFPKDDNQIGMYVHFYQSLGKRYLNHRQLKLKEWTIAIVSKNVEQFWNCKLVQPFCRTI